MDNYQKKIHGKLIKGLGCKSCPHFNQVKKRVVNDEVASGITLTSFDLDGPFDFCSTHEIGDGVCGKWMAGMLEDDNGDGTDI